MKKRFICIFMIATLLLSTVSSFAYQENDLSSTFSPTVEMTTISEYEEALHLTEQLNAVKEFDAISNDITPLDEYKLAFDERAQLPAETLKDLGYSEEEIQLLKDYADGKLSFDEVAPRASAVLSTVLSSSLYTTTQYKVRYTWSWDKTPAGTKKDTAILAVQGIDSSSHTLNTRISNKESKVTYYVDDTYNKVESATLEVNGSYVTATYNKYKLTDNGNNWMWVKSGYLEVTLVPSISGGDTFAAVRARGELAVPTPHVDSYSIAVAYSPSGTITITLTVETGRGTISHYGKVQKVFYNNGTYKSET